MARDGLRPPHPQLLPLQRHADPGPGRGADAGMGHEPRRCRGSHRRRCGPGSGERARREGAGGSDRRTLPDLSGLRGLAIARFRIRRRGLHQAKGTGDVDRRRGVFRAGRQLRRERHRLGRQGRDVGKHAGGPVGLVVEGYPAHAELGGGLLLEPGREARRSNGEGCHAAPRRDRQRPLAGVLGGPLSLGGDDRVRAIAGCRRHPCRRLGRLLPQGPRGPRLLAEGCGCR
mmetsp:Transcript_93539/g.183387  ORF Transcript_93539/g.183387 Transcript_93539/m.183387 type:complete len:230 (-) Transcript_93539:307-996(-)